MRYSLVAAFTLLAASGAAAQDFTPQFYIGVTGGVGPTFTVPAEHWNSDEAIFSAGAFAGANLLHGNMLYGLEASFSHDSGKSNITERYLPNTLEPLPRYQGSGTCWGCEFPAGGVERSVHNGGRVAEEILSYTYSETMTRPALTARVGLQHDNLTLYGKAGLGVAQRRITEVHDARGTIDCEAMVYEQRWSGESGREAHYESWYTECINPQRGELETATRELWSPTFVYGLGAEYDFGQFFARGEAEVTHIVSGSATVRANVGLGLRF